MEVKKHPKSWKKSGGKKNGSKKKVGVQKIIKKKSGVKNKNPSKSKYKGNPFIFICAEFFRTNEIQFI